MYFRCTWDKGKTNSLITHKHFFVLAFKNCWSFPSVIDELLMIYSEAGSPQTFLVVPDTLTNSIPSLNNMFQSIVGQNAKFVLGLQNLSVIRKLSHGSYSFPLDDLRFSNVNFTTITTLHVIIGSQTIAVLYQGCCHVT